MLVLVLLVCVYMCVGVVARGGGVVDRGVVARGVVARGGVGSTSVDALVGGGVGSGVGADPVR